MEARSIDPRQHVNEEPRNDFSDLMFGFGAMTGFMFVVFFGMVIVKFIIS
ncbi:YqzM family protein [Paenibacillus apiarius]|uniref:YqzM family protein n=1 Tax=Paenibacillus apiarius TaxID=46240 RepID=A0ABT4E1K4_9BACL|nr:YqzM family protein [Paenibacillus apiarius]MCY9512636.1 YqzM family protein [Paenibacillus apiarius]MCY9522393.1 YqzM family protein [Paenibacillus apiarius]MCY9553642.1 YqzM family protein [Paenibacillus apiarius]MCY9556586.1 YqzM family protein [Paenibacillus apiarius]MCY9682877.1 YqzM family protein [Paenibacillus apiarius]